MNKKLVLFAIALVSCLNGYIRATQEKREVKVADLVASGKTDLRIGFIDSFRVMRESEQGVEVAKNLMKQQEEKVKELQKEEQSLNQAANEYKTKASALNDSTRAKEEERLVKMKRTLENKAKETEEEMQLTMQRETERIAKDMEVAVAKLAEENKFHAVVDTMTGRVLYTAPEVNYTSSAIDHMNKSHRVKLAQARTDKKEVLASNDKNRSAAPAA